MARKQSTTGSKVTSSAALFLKIITGLAVIIFLGTGWVWWHNIRSNPETVFKEMIANSLRTTAVTDHIKQTSSGQELDQTINLMTTPVHVAHAEAVLSQQGDTSASVTTETIGTPFTDYVRYVNIATDQKDTNGKALDFSKVLNIWGKAGTGADPTSTNGEIYNQTILSVVPIANLPVGQRKELLNQIENQGVYTTAPSVDRHIENGRPTYTYKVTIKPQAYVAMLKTLGHDLGLSQLETVRPEDYASAQSIDFNLSVDVWTRTLKSISYTSGDRTETFSAYGLHKNIAFPKDTISTEDLQTRVQSLQ